MKNILAFLITLIAFTSLAQTNTEIYLFDILKKGNKQTLFNKKNISNNNGYDNQPYIIEDSVVLFSSTRNNQTDIAAYNIQQTK
ncbi:steroid delta-isomerase, partial [Aquimarina celericrescens]|nr:steroid delta-isomerase [Aquimarina celericrescens]